MGEKDVAGSIASDLTNAVTDFNLGTEDVDGVQDQETTWTNDKWTLYQKQFKEIPEFNKAIETMATWTVGKGFIANPQTTFILDRIRGNGFDSFNSILWNAVVVYYMGGDFYGHIVRDEEDNLINLKPLNPGSMQNVVGKDGMFIRFEQINRTSGKKVNTFGLKDIFYLPRNRIADEIHGTPLGEKLQFIINARNEAMADYKQVMHRFVKPRWMIKLDTDKPAKIAVEKAKWDKANEDGENMYVPMGAVEAELMSISPNATLSPQAWIEQLNDYFYEACGVPKIIVGNSKSFTDASGKVAYLAFEQNVSKEQLFLTEQVGLQLGMKMELKFPASLQQDLLTGKQKDSSLQATQPNDTVTELEGNT